MSHVEQLSDLKALSELVDVQVSVGLDKGDVLEAQFKTWSHRLQAVPADDKATKELTAAIGASPFSAEQKRALGKILMESQAASHKSVRRVMQYCPHFENMVTMQEWAALRKQGTLMSARLAMLALRAWLIGVECPSEGLLYRIVAIAAYAGGDAELDQDHVSQYMSTVQAAIKSRGSKRDGIEMPHIAKYPASADQLPDSIQQYAYNMELPEQVSIPDLDTILAGAKVRGGRAAPNLKWIENVPPQFRALVQTALQRQTSAPAFGRKLSSVSSASSAAALPPPFLEHDDEQVFGDGDGDARLPVLTLGHSAAAFKPKAAVKALVAQPRRASSAFVGHAASAPRQALALKPPPEEPCEEDDAVGGDHGALDSMEAAFLSGGSRAALKGSTAKKNKQNKNKETKVAKETEQTAVHAEEDPNGS